MKKVAVSHNVLILMMSGMLAYSASAQQTSWSVGFSSGLFKFIGATPEKTTQLYTSTNLTLPINAQTANPYGNNYALCYGINGGIERISKSKWKFGSELGFEVRRSMINIDKVSRHDGIVNATGKTFMQMNTINLFPYLGHSINIKNTSWDLVAGVETSYIIDSREKGSTIDIDNTLYVTNRDRTNIHFDFSPSFKLNCRYKHIGLYAGYSAGTINYLKGYIGGVSEVYGRMIRFGMKWIWLTKKQSHK
jgi:hypothetical protein